MTREPGRTRVCSRLPPASAPPTLPAAAEALALDVFSFDCALTGELSQGRPLQGAVEHHTVVQQQQSIVRREGFNVRQ